MKVNKWKKFLEAERDDEYSFLNDDLDANSNDDDYDEYDDILWRDYPKSKSPQNFKKLSTFDDFDDFEDDDSDIDYYKGRPYHGSHDEDDDNVNTDDDDYNTNLASILRKMFLRSGIHAEIDSDNNEILICCKMKRTENIKDVIEVFEIVKKIKKDILAQYDSEFEMFTKGGVTQFLFSFYIGDGLGDDNNSEDDSPF